MEDTEVKVEEQINETSISEHTSSSEEVIKNYEKMIKEQQGQIENLMKQQELNRKVQAQQAEMLQDFVKKNSQINEQHWVDKVLSNEFKFDGVVDPSKNYSKFMNGTGKDLAVWWLQYQKQQGLSNDEISSRYKRMAEGMSTGIQPHEEI